MPPGGPEQGLFVCLPAEELTLAGFGQGGRADTMAPGPLLASVLHAITGQDGAGLAGLSDDQLIGVMSAVRRMESRAAWTLMAAMREFASRRPAQDPAQDGPARDGAADDSTGFDEFAGDELTGTLHLTWQSAAEQIGYACAVASRLPATFAALGAGQLHPVHVRIIEDETRVLSEADAALADEKLAEAAASKTFGQLRYAAHRLVLKLDPDAARRRQEQARRDAHVRRFREDSGNAGMNAPPTRKVRKRRKGRKSRKSRKGPTTPAIRMAGPAAPAPRPAAPVRHCGNRGACGDVRLRGKRQDHAGQEAVRANRTDAGGA